jgi:hypothetical protein
MKIIINKCFGGFGLSPLAYEEYAKRKGVQIYWYCVDYSGEIEAYEKVSSEEINGIIGAYLHPITKDLGDYFTENDIDKVEDFNNNYFKIDKQVRTDETLISVVEDLGNKANGDYAELKVVEIPDDVDYYIDDYDGIESIHERHRTWG